MHNRHFTLPQSNLASVTPPQSDRLGQGAKYGLSPWAPTGPTLILPKISVPVMPFAHNLCDDPAFSPDPLSHPFFATGHDQWLPAPASVNPLPLLSSSLTLQSLELDGMHLPQSFNLASTWADDSTTTTSHETTSSNASTSTSSRSTVPTSHDSHFSKATEAPIQPPVKPPSSSEKKKSPMSMPWRKIPAETGLHIVDRKLDDHSEPPPSYEVILSNSPKSTRNMTSPQRTLETPVAPLPPTTKPPPARRIVAGVSINAHELDRIDELDESNPMGLPVHHDGPYEAILKSLLHESEQREPHNIGSQYQLLPPSHPSIQDGTGKKLNPPQTAQISYIPPGLPLNLNPGQILSYDFQLPQAHLGQGRTNASQLSSIPVRELGARVEKQIMHPQPGSNNTHYGRHNGSDTFGQDRQFVLRGDKRLPAHLQGMRLNFTATPSMGKVDYKKDRRISASRVPSSSSELNIRGHHIRGVQPVSENTEGMVIQSDKNSQEEISGSYAHPPVDRLPYRSKFNNGRLPPRMQALQRDQAKYNGQRNEVLRHSLDPFSENLDFGRFAKENVPIYAGTPLEQNLLRNPSPLFAGMDQTVRFTVDDDPPHHTMQSVMGSRQNSAPKRLHTATPRPPQSRNLDTQSLQQSVATEDSSVHTNTGNLRSLPRPRHIPKRLVMPAPLQGSQPVEPKYRPNPQPPPPRHMNLPDWFPGRGTQSPSPPFVLPPTLTPYRSGLLEQVQDISPQGRKLRKQGISEPSATHPFSRTPLTFEPIVEYRNLRSTLPIHLPHSKLEKVSRKVLIKKRTDF